MKLTDLTPEQVATYEQYSVADANFFTDKLARLQRRFVLAHARHQLALDLEDMCGTQPGAVTLTVTGPTGTLTLDGYRFINEAGIFSEKLGAELERIKDDIMATLKDRESFRDDRKEAGDDEDMGTQVQRELFALCMPETPALPVVRPFLAESLLLAATAEKAA